MSKGIALHVGVNEVDPAHYGGWRGTLRGCEKDATDLAAIARAAGFEAQTLLTADARRDVVLGAIEAAAACLTSGDTFLLTYAGHGGQVPDLDGDEDDQLDETWVLHDGQIVDDELSRLWLKFAAGVRVVVLSDSCHSGTITKLQPYGILDESGSLVDERAGVFRFMPDEVAVKTYRDSRPLYDAIARAAPSSTPTLPAAATILLLSACQDDQLALDGDDHGLFTAALLSTWQGGAFQGDYPALLSAIATRMPKTQKPNYLVLGQSNPGFEHGRPFDLGRISHQA